MTEDQMVRWHHRLSGHEFEQALGDGEGQGSLACCSLWGCKKSDMTERLNNNKTKITYIGQSFQAFVYFGQLSCFFFHTCLGPSP